MTNGDDESEVNSIPNEGQEQDQGLIYYRDNGNDIRAESATRPKFHIAPPFGNQIFFKTQ